MKNGFGLVTAFLALLFAASSTPQATAASFKSDEPAALNDPAALDFEPRCNLRMVGEIFAPDSESGEIGDYERAKIALDAFKRDRRRPVAAGDTRADLKPPAGFFALCLSSDGGDLREALRVATLFKEHWMTVVEEGHKCLSACAVLFMQARRREGVFNSLLHETYPGRYMHYGARLGFHAPALIYPPGSSETVAKEEAEQAYGAALTSLEALLPNEAMVFSSTPIGGATTATAVADVARKYVGVARSPDDFPAELLVRMLTTPNSDMLEIKTTGEAHAYGISVFGLPVPKQITDRLVFAACASVQHVQCKNLRPDGQCLDHFASLSGTLAVARLAGPRYPPDLNSAAGQHSVIHSLLGDCTVCWMTEETELLPRSKAEGGPRDLAIALRNRQKSEDIPCAMIATFDGERVAELTLQTRHGVERGALVHDSSTSRRARIAATITADGHNYRNDPHLLVSPSDGITAASAHETLVEKLAEPEPKSRLHLYKMLPPSTPLTELSDDVWSWYEQGKPIGSPITGVVARHSPAIAIEAASDNPTTTAATEFATPQVSADERATANAIRIAGWTRAGSDDRVTLISPTIGGKAGITLDFGRVENPNDAGGMDTWFKTKIDAALTGVTIRERQGLMRKGPVWIDAVSLPNAQGKGGTILFYKAWATRDGAQFLVETLPEHVADDDPAAFQADELIGRLSVQGVGLTPEVVRAIQLSR